jgi:hypothetical protein
MKKNELHVFTNSQSEFWAREMGCRAWKVDDKLMDSLQELINLGLRPIIEIDGNLERFQNLPRNSLIALLNTDEKYDVIISEVCLKSDVFVGLIRQYTTQKTSATKTLGAILKGIMESSKIFEWNTPRRTIGWGIEGLGMVIRQRKIMRMTQKFGKPTINIPLGYTDYFVESYNQEILSRFKIRIDPEESLLTYASNNLDSLNNKKFDFVFIGQIGQIVRFYAINALKKFHSKRLVVRNGYGGVSNDENRKLRIGEEYVSGLMDSRVSVCPPGNISGNSYRIMESLICGAYPAVMSNVLCDPQFESPVIEVLQESKPRTWSRYLKKLEKVSEAKLQLRVVENLNKISDEIKVAKLEIQNLQARN